MNDDKKSDAERPDEEETRSDDLKGRRFELADAIGRENAEMLKGASPVARSRQILFEIELFLEDRLRDPDGSLLRTLRARLQENPPLLAGHFDHPLGALAELVDSYLGDDAAASQALAALVRDADARWGREYAERPRFERDGQPPADDDPYTIAQVRATLEDLRAALPD